MKSLLTLLSYTFAAISGICFAGGIVVLSSGKEL